MGQLVKVGVKSSEIYNHLTFYRQTIYKILFKNYIK